MTLSVRIPLRVEQELAEYCARNGVSKSEAVKDALDRCLSGTSAEKSPYEVDFPSVSRELAVAVLEEARAALIADAHPA